MYFFLGLDYALDPCLRYFRVGATDTFLPRHVHHHIATRIVCALSHTLTLLEISA